MSFVVFLRGLNVGGHRSFRPTRLAKQLRHLDAVNIGAAGTFVIREAVSRSELRKEIARRVPFDAVVAICRGSEVLDLLANDALESAEPNAVRFVSVLSRRARVDVKLPIAIPSNDGWLVKVIAVEPPFILGVYRRHMKVIGYLGSLDRVFGAPLTTRSWSTIAAIGKVLSAPRSRRA